MRHSRVADIREANRVACHEAAHAVARWFNGRPISSITIVGRQLEDGRTINGRVSGSAIDLDSDADYFSRMVEVVAGSVGETVFLGESVGLRGSDERKAKEYARMLASNANARSMLIAAARVEAEAIIRKHENAFRALVQELLARSVMSGRDVVALIERTRS